MVYVKLDRAFEELEKEVVKNMERRHEEAGIYSVGRVKRHQGELEERITELGEMVKSLKTERCLASMIRFYS